MQSICTIYLASSECFRRYYICTETNEYAPQKVHHSFNLDISDIELFLGVLLLSGYVSLPQISMYCHPIASVQQCAITAISTLPTTLPWTLITDLPKCVPLLDHANNASCLANFQLEQTDGVHESTIPFFGRHRAKRYLHGKPIKFGHKKWVLSTALEHVISSAHRLSCGWKYRQRDRFWGFDCKTPITLYSTISLQAHGLLRLLADNGLAATGTLHPYRTDVAPMKSLENWIRNSVDHIRCCVGQKILSVLGLLARQALLHKHMQVFSHWLFCI